MPTPSPPAAGCATRALAELLCEDAPDCIRELDAWGVGWARKDGHITATQAPGHDRPRCVYVDFINTGPAVSKTLRMHLARNPVDPQSRRPVHRRSCGRRRRGHRCGRLSSWLRRAGRHRGQGDHPGDRRTDAAVPPQQRLGQYGRRRLCARFARRRFAHRHGIRPVLSDRASGAAARRHGSDHVGSVPLQARRQASQRLQRGIHLEIRLRRGRQICAHPRSGDLRHHQGSRGRPRLAAWRRLPVVRALQRGGVAQGIRTGDRSAGGQRHRSHQDGGRGRADRALSHGRREGRRAHDERPCPASMWPAKWSAAPTAPTGCPAMPSPKLWCSAAAPGGAPPRTRSQPQKLRPAGLPRRARSAGRARHPVAMRRTRQR